jgi:hypothetical protein
MQLSFAVPLCKSDSVIKYRVRCQSVFSVDVFPVSLDLGLASVMRRPVWVEFAREGIPVARDVATTALIER